jgi:phage repressor protein C with HTH and peptisase S24 domain
MRYGCTMDMIDRLEWAFGQSGFTSKAELARAARLNPTTLRAYFQGHAKPPLDVCMRIGPPMGVSATWLFSGEGERTKVDAQPFIPLPVEPVTAQSMIPIYGTAIGGEDGRFEMNGQVIDRVAAPPGLMTAQGAYGVMVAGESMEPRYHSGETVYVHPQKPVMRGGYVVVQLWPEIDGDPVGGLVKRFISMNDEVLRLEQFNPPKVIEIPRSRVKAVHRIVLGGE